MLGLRGNLRCCITENEVGCGYHYLITCDALSETAFRTVYGYKRYLERTGLIPKHVDSFLHPKNGKTEVYRLHGRYREQLFSKMDEIPMGADKFVGLCNWSYVDCYYADVDGVRTIFRPNSNAEEVYKPYEWRYLQTIILLPKQEVVFC